MGSNTNKTENEENEANEANDTTNRYAERNANSIPVVLMIPKLFLANLHRSQKVGTEWDFLAIDISG